MEKIALASKIEFKKGKEVNNEQIIIDALYPGYGPTLGNALRRVLLSSIPGAAVIGVKIKGADHEFMALPGIKEDVLQIILNLKKLRLKVHCEETVTLNLKVTGQKTVTAANIEKNSDVEIINKDLEIANITEKKGEFEAEIFVARGLGYETVESREEETKETGYIELDSMYSPVKKVGIQTENMRVGKMTNWDRLILDVTTDGIMSPKETFEMANEILIEQFSALTGEKKDKKSKK